MLKTEATGFYLHTLRGAEKFIRKGKEILNSKIKLPEGLEFSDSILYQVGESDDVSLSDLIKECEQRVKDFVTHYKL